MKVYQALMMILMIGFCSACSQSPDPDVLDPEFKILITVNQMIGAEEESSRTYGSMTPDRENSIKTLSVFQFDTEGNLRVLDSHTNKRYLFKKFTDLGDPNGIPRVRDIDMPELSLLQTGETMYTCFVANISENLLLRALFPRGESDPVVWNEFQTVEFEMPFAQSSDISLDPTLEPGHLTSSYMFGYYHGDVPATGFTIGLGRILTRLKINFNIPDYFTVTESMKFYIAAENVETHAYFSVSKDSPHHHYTDREAHLLNKEYFDLTENGINHSKNIIQFYCAPHVGERITAENCTCLYFWCVNDDKVPTMSDADKAKAVRIPLGADPENGQFNLARNTLYSFNVKFEKPKETE